MFASAVSSVLPGVMSARASSGCLPTRFSSIALVTPLDVVQALPDLLQALGPVGDTECGRAGRRSASRVGGILNVVIHSAHSASGSYFDACQYFRRKGPGRTGLVAIRFADACDELQMPASSFR